MSGQSRAVVGKETGYIQKMDDEGLMAVAREKDLVLRLRYRPGDYLLAGRSLLEAWPGAELDEDSESRLRNAFSLGAERTPTNDLDFLVNELVEIATRALSSGINDPTTASTCIDWLGAGATELARRSIPDSHRTDDEGRVRVIAAPDGFARYFERAFGRLRQYAAGDMNAALHLLRTFGEVAAGCSSQDQVDAIDAEADRLAQAAEVALDGPALRHVRHRAEELRQLLALGPGRIDERQAHWLGGSA